MNLLLQNIKGLIVDNLDSNDSSRPLSARCGKILKKYTDSRLKALYPVDSIYLTCNNNNPGNFLGGTWVQFGQGRTLIGEGTGNDGSTSMTFTASDSGGEYKHKLTINEMPNGIWHSNGDNQTGGLKLAFSQGSNFGINTLATNFDQPHNNIQPYIVVYFWRRTA